MKMTKEQGQFTQQLSSDDKSEQTSAFSSEMVDRLIKMKKEQSKQSSQENESEQTSEFFSEIEESDSEQISEQVQSKQSQKTKGVVCRYPKCEVQCHKLNSIKVPLKDNEKRKQWNKILGWKGPKQAGRVCINHFVPDDDYYFEEGKPDANVGTQKILKFHPTATPQPQSKQTADQHGANNKTEIKKAAAAAKKFITCKDCGAYCLTENSLKVHMERFHPNKIPCHVCSEPIPPNIYSNHCLEIHNINVQLKPKKARVPPTPLPPQKDPKKQLKEEFESKPNHRSCKKIPKHLIRAIQKYQRCYEKTKKGSKEALTDLPDQGNSYQ